MKWLLIFALAMFGVPALATNPVANARSDSMSNSSSGNGDAWAVSLPGFGQGSFAGNYSICVKLHIIFFGLDTQSGPDMDCVREIARLTQLLATPVPKPTVYPMADMSERPRMAYDSPNAMDADAEKTERYQRALDQVRAADCANATKASAHKPTKPVRTVAGCFK